jgi:hypothetical protein
VAENHFGDRTQMNLFQTSLYLFSSLLQADAAILGFGAIFVIYKIQSLENIRQNIIQTYQTKGPGYTGIVNTLILGESKAIAAILENEKDMLNFRNFKYIVCIPAKSIEIGKSIRRPIIIIGSHTILCGVLLFLSQYFFPCIVLQNSVLVITLLWFAIGVISAYRLAINSLIKLENYIISKLRTDILDFVVNKEDTRWHRGE